MSNFVLDYDGLMQDALRCVVRDVLMITAELKETPGDHHFYIEFLTTADGVSIPKHLQDTYPTRMTVVLHHQFENLIVDDKGFSVTLWFKGVEAKLVIPFDSITSFADPSVKFGLRFQEGSVANSEELNQNVSEGFFSDDNMPTRENTSQDKSNMSSVDMDEKNTGKTGTDNPTSKSSDNESADVVSLDAFRKK